MERSHYEFFVKGKLKKLLLTIEISAFLFLSPLVAVNASDPDSHARDTRLSFNLNNVTGKEVTDDIGKPAGFNKVPYPELSGNSIEIHLLQQNAVAGRVTDAKNNPIPGVTIVIKGTTLGTVTDANGNYTLPNVPQDAVIVFSFIGMTTQEISAAGKNRIDVTMAEETIGLEEVVVIGYGSQKKGSMVGAIVQTKTEELKRAGGVVTLTDALTGQLPGVTTIKNTGMPGKNEPMIIVRAVGTWNNSAPLILVDGIERSMGELDVNEVETISVLKDASATAVFGVRGAEGVIMVTTKRGKMGKPQLSFDYNTSVKLLSKIPEKLDSYETLKIRNSAIEYELQSRSDSWGYMTPTELLLKYRKPQTGTTWGIPDSYIFPNTDWIDEMINPFPVSHHANLNVTGGTNFTKYFGSLGYTYDADMLRSNIDNGKPYDPKYAYQRINYRTNMDFNLTKSTIFSVNLSGWIGTAYDNYVQNKYGTETRQFAAIYGQSPFSMVARYPTGEWGYNGKMSGSIDNVLSWLVNKGVETVTRTNVSTNFTLRQKLDFITPGLSLEGLYSYDSQFTTAGGVFDLKWSTGLNEYRKYIDPDIFYNTDPAKVNNFIYGTERTDTGREDFDFVLQPAFYIAENFGYSSAGLDYWSLPYPLPFRRSNYQLQLNYARRFSRHDISALALVKRETFAEGSMFPRYREDWVGRVTYNYDERYLFEANAAYNGSERFGKGYRFGFFPSVAVGWMASNENFLKYNWLQKLKLRYSIGRVGNDNFAADRWAYSTIWTMDNGTTTFGYPSSFASPFVQYYQSVIGNPDLHWETSVKQNYGLELAVLRNRVSLNFDYFTDNRSGIFMSAAQRKIPAYFGANPVPANIGKTRTHGYELELKYEDMISENSLHYWFKWDFTFAIDEVVFQEDPQLLPEYQKNEGYQINQTRSQMYKGHLNNWDDVYSSVYWATNDIYKAPGDYRMVDFNGDGTLDTYDSAPYGYPYRPQHTYGFWAGASYKGFSAMVQFYGVYNVMRPVYYLTPFGGSLKGTCFDMSLVAWTPDNIQTQDYGPTRALRTIYASPGGTEWLYDASYLRLKTAEISYTLQTGWLQRLRISSARIFLNGNNLLIWSKLPDDLETFSLRTEGTAGMAYPMYRLVNLGISMKF